MSERDELYREVARLQGIEQRCRQAEEKLMAMETRNRLLGDNAPFGIFTVGLDGCITAYNRQMEEMIFWRRVIPDETADRSDSRLMAPVDVGAELEQCIVSQKMHITEHAYPDGQGGSTHLRYYFSPIPGIDGAVSEIMVFVEDCTELKRVEKELKESEKRYRRLYQAAPIAMIERDVTLLQGHLAMLRERGIVDLQQYLVDNPHQVYQCWSMIKTIDHNPAYFELMELQDCESSAGEFAIADDESFLAMAREIVLAIARGNSVNEGEVAVVTARGRKKFVMGKSMVISGREDTSSRIVVALIDITQRRIAEESLKKSELRFREQSLRDNLTGLFNQRYLYHSLPELIESAEENGSFLSLLFLDLDRFKHIVDTYGHLNGSMAIREVAQTIDSCLQEPSYGVAYAGDEFVVVLPGYNQSQALGKAFEIRNRLTDTVYTLDQDIEIRLAASFGVATYPDHAGDAKSLIAAADQALFVVKATGKNDVSVYRKD